MNKSKQITVPNGAKMQQAVYRSRDKYWRALDTKTHKIPKGGKYDLVDTDTSDTDRKIFIIKVNGDDYMIDADIIKEARKLKAVMPFEGAKSPSIKAAILKTHAKVEKLKRDGKLPRPDDYRTSTMNVQFHAKAFKKMHRVTTELFKKHVDGAAAKGVLIYLSLNSSVRYDDGHRLIFKDGSSLDWYYDNAKKEKLSNNGMGPHNHFSESRYELDEAAVNKEKLDEGSFVDIIKEGKGDAWAIIDKKGKLIKTESDIDKAYAYSRKHAGSHVEDLKTHLSGGKQKNKMKESKNTQAHSFWAKLNNSSDAPVVHARLKQLIKQFKTTISAVDNHQKEQVITFNDGSHIEFDVSHYSVTIKPENLKTLSEDKYTNDGLQLKHTLNMAQTFWWKLNKGKRGTKSKKVFLKMLSDWIRKNKVLYKTDKSNALKFMALRYNLNFKDRSSLEVWAAREGKGEGITIGGMQGISGRTGNMFNSSIKVKDLDLTFTEGSFSDASYAISEDVNMSDDDKVVAIQIKQALDEKETLDSGYLKAVLIEHKRLVETYGPKYITRQLDEATADDATMFRVNLLQAGGYGNVPKTEFDKLIKSNKSIIKSYEWVGIRHHVVFKDGSSLKLHTDTSKKHINVVSINGVKESANLGEAKIKVGSKVVVAKSSQNRGSFSGAIYQKGDELIIKRIKGSDAFVALRDEPKYELGYSVDIKTLKLDEEINEADPTNDSWGDTDEELHEDKSNAWSLWNGVFGMSTGTSLINFDSTVKKPEYKKDIKSITDVDHKAFKGWKERTVTFKDNSTLVLDLDVKKNKLEVSRKSAKVLDESINEATGTWWIIVGERKKIVLKQGPYRSESDANDVMGDRYPGVRSLVVSAEKLRVILKSKMMTFHKDLVDKDVNESIDEANGDWVVVKDGKVLKKFKKWEAASRYAGNNTGSEVHDAAWFADHKLTEESINETPYQVVKTTTKKSKGGGEGHDIIITTRYDIQSKGKKVGELVTDDYFGYLSGVLNGKDLPELSGYDSGNKRSNPQSQFIAFTKTATGKKFLKVNKLKEEITEASSMNFKVTKGKTHDNIYKKDNVNARTTYYHVKIDGTEVGLIDHEELVDLETKKILTETLTGYLFGKRMPFITKLSGKNPLAKIKTFLMSKAGKKFIKDNQPALQEFVEGRRVDNMHRFKKEISTSTFSKLESLAKGIKFSLTKADYYVNSVSVADTYGPGNRDRGYTLGGIVFNVVMDSEAEAKAVVRERAEIERIRKDTLKVLKETKIDFSDPVIDRIGATVYIEFKANMNEAINLGDK